VAFEFVAVVIVVGVVGIMVAAASVAVAVTVEAGSSMKHVTAIWHALMSLNRDYGNQNCEGHPSNIL